MSENICAQRENRLEHKCSKSTPTCTCFKNYLRYFSDACKLHEVRNKAIEIVFLSVNDTYVHTYSVYTYNTCELVYFYVCLIKYART